MASPLLSSFCCEFHCHDTENATCQSKVQAWEPSLSDGALSYNILCILSSVIGIIGAVYQLRLRLQDLFGSSFPIPEVIDRQSKTIFWLAAADGIASLGILIRSCVWLALPRLLVLQIPHFNELFCAVISGWIQYFYICTYLWTILFAVDTYKNAGDRNKCSIWIYHVLAWGISFIICAVGLIVLYYPGLESCGDNNLSRRLPHYLASYIPMVCVMIVNPILLWKSKKLVHNDLKLRGSSLNEQKEIVGEVMSRFFSVVLIFYACWLPNIVNGILLLSMTVNMKLSTALGQEFIIALWQMMALLNPIQGFLNSLVYSNIALWPNTQLMKYRQRHSTSTVPASAVDAAEGGTTAEGEMNEDPGSFSDQEPVWDQERTDSPLLLFR